VQVTGIFRAIPMRQARKARTLNAVFKTYLDVIHFQKNRGVKEKATANGKVQKKEGEEADDVAVSKEGPVVDENGVKHISEINTDDLDSLGKDPKIYDMLIESLAPSIWEMDDIKKGILCLLFGGACLCHERAPSLANFNFCCFFRWCS
jgi:DNA replication licensing factor MCM4